MNFDPIKDLMDVVNFAAEKHKDQRRKNAQATPYINHPIGVAYILTEVGITDPVVIKAALLHDTVEDADTTIKEITDRFGIEVAGVVAEVTDDKSLSKDARKRHQVAAASGASERARLVKLADKLYNLRDLRASPPVGWPDARIHEYFRWSAEVLGGLRGTCKALEDKLDAIIAADGPTFSAADDRQA